MRGQRFSDYCQVPTGDPGKSRGAYLQSSYPLRRYSLPYSRDASSLAVQRERVRACDWNPESTKRAFPWPRRTLWPLPQDRRKSLEAGRSEWPSDELRFLCDYGYGYRYRFQARDLLPQEAGALR